MKKRAPSTGGSSLSGPVSSRSYVRKGGERDAPLLPTRTPAPRTLPSGRTHLPLGVVGAIEVAMHYVGQHQPLAIEMTGSIAPRGGACGMVAAVGVVVLASTGTAFLASLVWGGEPQVGDIPWVVGALAIVLLVFLNSPLRRVIADPEFREYCVQDSGADVSTPLALLSGVIAGRRSLEVPVAPSAAGPGPPGAAASDPAPSPLSREGLENAAQLADLLHIEHPLVVGPLAVVRGVGLVQEMLHAGGDALRREATRALRDGRYPDAYAACMEASTKSHFRKPSGHSIARWHAAVDEQIRERRNELSDLRALALDVCQHPLRRCTYGAIIGGVCGLVFGSVPLYHDVCSVWAPGAAMLACALFAMERRLSMAIAYVITTTPVLYGELDALQQLRAVAI
jgi:hypothetical protein